MKTLLALGFVIVATSLTANAQVFTYPFAPVCGLAYRYESYSLGFDKVYRQTNKSPVKMDEFCYELGETAAKELLKHEDERDCREAYAIAVAQGLSGVSYGPIQTPSECYNPGVPVGLTLLSVKAREEFKSGTRSACARAYKEGREASQRNQVPTLSGDNLKDHCYNTGYADFQLYGDNF